MLSLKLLSHGKSDRALVQSLISSNGHLDLISDSEEEKATLRLIQSHLSDDLVKALGEELFSDGTDTALSGLTLHQLLVQHLSQSCYINSSSFLMTNVLNVVFAYIQRLDFLETSSMSVDFGILDETYHSQPTL